MSDPPKDTFPDISDILARKADARKERAKLSFAEKIRIVETMRERVAPFRKAREQRQAARAKSRAPD